MVVMTKGGQRLRLREARGEHGSTWIPSLDSPPLVWMRNNLVERARPGKTGGIATCVGEISLGIS